jgi:hypothetical protein
MPLLPRIHFFLAGLFFFCTAAAQEQRKVVIRVDAKKTYQTIRNFAASDAWACQFVGNWPQGKKNAIADLLFSMDTLAGGSPKGIGLSMWRYNLGAGSAEQNDSSSIIDEWRRAALTTNTNGDVSKKVVAQNWFLKAAKQRGVKQFLGFFNSPPVQFTINGKAHATAGKSNIGSSKYAAFAGYTVDAIKAVKKSTGIEFNYISPVNEPQWDWSDNKQEGCPYDNQQVSAIVKSLNLAFVKNKISSQILITESGQYNYLLSDGNKPGKGNQVNDFFKSSSTNYIGNLSNVSKTIASHSYFTTSPFDKAMALRSAVKDSVAAIKDLELWQSEYCILGGNEGELDGDKKDLGINAALYVAKVMYEDLVAANVSAWQWWTAISPYDYKDGLIYIDKAKTDGQFSDSKMLWAMGNYSRFVRPGMQRIDVSSSSDNLLVSGYKDVLKGSIVLVFVNAADREVSVAIDNVTTMSSKKIVTYTTSETQKLEKGIAGKTLAIPAKSIVTVLIN